MVGSDSGFYSGCLDDAAARSLYPGLDAVTAGWVAPVGILEVCDGGYRLSGRWSSGSGVTHADVIVGGARVTENGSPRILADGTPEVRIAMLPAVQWQVLRLRSVALLFGCLLTRLALLLSRMDVHWGGRCGIWIPSLST
jgi:hypothetical protein